jgi:hydrogenase expression/formation protein HypE
MSVRNGLSFESEIESDCAPVSHIVMDLLAAGIEVHCMRDLTRGGLASALVEIAEVAKVHVALEESAIRVEPAVQGACELLGLDPLHIANEGRFVAFVAPQDAERALDVMRSHSAGANACKVGQITAANDGLVTMRSLIGVTRIVDMLSGEQLPRIC